MRSLGICVGSSNISVVEILVSGSDWEIISGYSKAHEGKTRETFCDIIKNHQTVTHIAVTGRSFKNRVKLPTISEPEAVEIAYSTVKQRYGNFNAIVSAGGEIFVAYELDSQGRIAQVYTGNKCASGTGEFFLQQIERMGLDLAQAQEIADINHPHAVAGRCSVFCKSDCTHALNKGEPKSQVVSGLSQMMARKIMELVHKTRTHDVLLVGGTAQNRVMVSFLKQQLSNLVVPAEAMYFEALGAAHWALAQGDFDLTNQGAILSEQTRSFSTLPRLAEHTSQVTFHEMKKATAKENERCLVGLDVGSTTTKAVVLRAADQAVVASVYLRTNGDPVHASRQCYTQLRKQLPEKLDLIGLGVTGSGRQIAGLHALTPAIINEIIAHATAAIYFDDRVDTILEIGGQDAKYTLINNKVPADYAMNEACSAGTGSFLEEAARESLHIPTDAIAAQALRGLTPPNFNDQCAAFISSDIKVATHEGLDIADICAGLVYSVCQNYNNRVKGSRKVGRHIFMQGGVCYNQAVPIAMAVLLGREIIVPPEPGLMGAFGVALETLQRIEQGILPEQSFHLEELANREVSLEKTFICAGGSEKCDRRCPIAIYQIDGVKYPFGGACNRYVNQVNKQTYATASLNKVLLREQWVENEEEPTSPTRGYIAIGQALSSYTYTPLFSTFFQGLGYGVIKPRQVKLAGIEQQGAAFCYPVEVAHGLMADLEDQSWDYLWMPQIRFTEPENQETGVACPLAQAEPYYIKSAFPAFADRMLTPVLDFTGDWDQVKQVMIQCATKQLGVSHTIARQAWEQARAAQTNLTRQMKQEGQQILDQLATDPSKLGIVLFGRPYNAFTSLTNMGIPHKFASRGQTILPYDFLPFHTEELAESMYWSHGQTILQATQFVRKHPQLFAVFITNFSCGPDSFIISYFRHQMGDKPSLTLELDSHTADAGLDTRIEAFLDIVDIYQKTTRPVLVKTTDYTPARVCFETNQLRIYDSQDKPHRLDDQRVHVLIPSMGDLASRMLAATLRFSGIRASACLPPGEQELTYGRANSSCKECLPLQLTIGSLLKHLAQRQDPDELLVYFMPTASGPCRFGQYNVLMKQLVMTQKIENVAFLSLTAQNGYAGLSKKVMLRVWGAMLIADVFADLHHTLMALATDQAKAALAVQTAEEQMIKAIEERPWNQVKELLGQIANRLSTIDLVCDPADAPKVFITGEIYVRQDQFARQNLVEKLADKGIIAHVAPIHEWVYYIDYLRYHRQIRGSVSVKEKIEMQLTAKVKRSYEGQIRKLLAKSGLITADRIDINEYLAYGREFMDQRLTGEAILTIGGTFAEIVDHCAGVLALGPFGCMPNRIAEAVVSKSLRQRKHALTKHPDLVAALLRDEAALPFLSIETDGNVFPPVIEARFETFCMQVKRLHQQIKQHKQE